MLSSEPRTQSLAHTQGKQDGESQVRSASQQERGGASQGGPPAIKKRRQQRGTGRASGSSGWSAKDGECAGPTVLGEIKKLITCCLLRGSTRATRGLQPRGAECSPTVPLIAPKRRPPARPSVPSGSSRLARRHLPAPGSRCAQPGPRLKASPVTFPELSDACQHRYTWRCRRGRKKTTQLQCSGQKQRRADSSAWNTQHTSI